ncbi:ARF GTPase-like protein activator [Saccharata proteae CBS 121410]|uniref:ADP-ribosylation factor GTPase-activating protein n=1 Tax=Saccharata proteae CBS 121410 TaxID=1314787 RepID=A0A9P4I2R1_9PEZI|nr:ARF GTPase-like protein activator [Saccharata proteae CBS 121410]
MGNISSRQGDGEPLYLRDQNRFSITALTITNSRNRPLLYLSPNSFPASRYAAKRDLGDDTPIEYVQDPESNPSAPPTFLLRLNNDEDLYFNFTFVVRQSSAAPVNFNSGAPTATSGALVDTVINGLTYAFASSSKELENLVTREFHADPNLHKNPNVELVGDYSTQGNQSFVEYDQRAHRLNTLASFSFWVSNTQRLLGSPKTLPHLEIGVPPRLRVPSAQSIDSRVSDSDGGETPDYRMPQSPLIDAIPENGLGLVPTYNSATTGSTVKVDLSCQRPGEDISALEDGPLFRANLKSYEKNTGDMRGKWKKVLKRAETTLEAQIACNNAVSDLMEALRETSTSNANAVQPAMDHYFDKIAKEILAYEKMNTVHVQRFIIEPISKLYNVDIKQAESKKKDFEDESKEYYAYVGRYLGQRQDSMKEKRRTETDTKYQSKRRNFELKRFDYSSYIQDLNGGRKNQEVLSFLTRYAEVQAKGFLSSADKIKMMLPQLEALSLEVKEADKEFQLQRTEREEKRRALEKSAKTYVEPEVGSIAMPSAAAQTSTGQSTGEGLTRSGSIAPVFKSTVTPAPIISSPPPTGAPPIPAALASPTPTAPSQGGSPANKFKGIRDLEEKQYENADGTETVQPPHKEGLLWALSRPGSHIDPKGLNKQAWHKFWITVGEGKLSEYSDWKNKMNLHMTPIDLRVASVREARNSERRFCFEVITPQFTRVYQTTSETDLNAWISAINNALQTAVENRGMSDHIATESLSHSTRRDIASVLTGKSSSLSGHRSSSNTGNAKPPSRHATVGDRPSYRSADVASEDASRLLQQIRDVDAGNKYCADCSSEKKVDWVSINLGIILCIDCSGAHRSLGSHISKVRSLTLDVHSFTPDIIELLCRIGNRVSNMIWEAKLDRSVRPDPWSTREARLRFINLKYAERSFVEPISPTLSHYATADETLLASIKKNDIQNVLWALALRADPNAKDRSRSTPALFLALAAADPASPSASASPATSPGLPPANATGPPITRKPFAVAELLLQNGADLPTQAPPFPLSLSAKLYLEHKTEQRLGKSAIGSLNGATLGAGSVGGASGPGHGDMLTALPTITAGNGSSPSERARERDARLQKRVSAGGRLMKSHDGSSSDTIKKIF